MPEANENTMLFHVDAGSVRGVSAVLRQVYLALEEKGYNPVSQIVGYLLSGDPTYITSHRNARSLIRSVDRDELLEELVKEYLNRP